MPRTTGPQTRSSQTGASVSGRSRATQRHGPTLSVSTGRTPRRRPLANGPRISTRARDAGRSAPPQSARILGRFRARIPGPAGRLSGGERPLGRSRARRAGRHGSVLLSQSLDPAAFLAAVRAHRTLDTSLHWGPNGTRGEDALRIRRDTGPESRARMRTRTLNLARMTDGGAVPSLRSQRNNAAGDDTVLFTRIRSGGQLTDTGEPARVQVR